jgi:hypothetical protein
MTPSGPDQRYDFLPEPSRLCRSRADAPETPSGLLASPREG